MEKNLSWQAQRPYEAAAANFQMHIVVFCGKVKRGSALQSL
jgi:hypothetical protein